jgi:hypothetical protein
MSKGNLSLKQDGLAKLLEDVRLLTYEMPDFKETWQKLFIRAVAIYQVSKYPAPHKLDPVEYDAFYREMNDWDNSLCKQTSLNGIDVRKELSSARCDAVKLQNWEIDFTINGIHEIAELIRMKNNDYDFSFGMHGEV